MRTKVISLCCVLFIVVILSIVASAATYGDLTYTISNGKVTITACNTSASGEIMIPDTIAGYPVAGIGSEAFLNCSNLTRITIPTSVSGIGEGAFRSCNRLNSITLPFVGANRNTVSGYQSVFGYIFGCTTSNSSDASIAGAIRQGDKYHIYGVGTRYYYYYIPNSLRDVTITDTSTIPTCAFHNCSMLTDIIIPSTVTDVGVSAFNSCSSLTSIEIPPLVTSIEDQVFAYCSNLSSITIALSVMSIGRFAFFGCSRLTSIEIWNANCSIYDNSTIPTGATIYGRADSTAQAYAQEYGRTFVALALPENPLSLSGAYTDGAGKLRFVTQVTTSAGDPEIEYFGTYIVPLTYFTENELTAGGEEQIGVGMVKYTQSIESGSSFAADLTSIPSAAYNAPIFAWSFVKFSGIETVYVETLGVFTVNGATLVKGGF